MVKKADGTVLFSTVSGTTPAKAPEAGVFTVTTNGALSIKVSGQSQPSYPANGVTNYVITKYLEAGTYTVYAEGVDNVDSSVTAKITTTFTVKDTQAKATAEVKANSVDARATTGSAYPSRKRMWFGEMIGWKIGEICPSQYLERPGAGKRHNSGEHPLREMMRKFEKARSS